MCFVLGIAQALRWIRMSLHGQVRDGFNDTFKVEEWTSAATCALHLGLHVRTGASTSGVGAVLFRCGAPVS